MKPLYGALYIQLKAELSGIEGETVRTMHQVELNFMTATRYWAELRKLVSNGWETEQDEIEFFKNIKPLFATEIEYYNLLYHAHIFAPGLGAGAEEMRHFWLREKDRLVKFTEENEHFVTYIKSGRVDADPCYFLRQEKSDAADHYLDPDTNFQTQGDLLLSKFMALERYTKYAEKRLDELVPYNKAGH